MSIAVRAERVSNLSGSPADLSVGEGLSPTRRRVPPQLIQFTVVPGGLVRWGGRMPDTAMSIAASNGAIYLRREYLIIGDPMWLDTWGGLEPDTAMSIAAAYSIYRGPHCA